MFSMRHTGTRQVQQMLRSLSTRGKTVLRDVAREVDRRHARAMRRKGIPRDTGRLEDSLTVPGHRDRVVQVSDRSISIGTRVEYAQYQRHRIGTLNRAEAEEVFIAPITEAFHSVIQGGGNG